MRGRRITCGDEKMRKESRVRKEETGEQLVTNNQVQLKPNLVMTNNVVSPNFPPHTTPFESPCSLKLRCSGTLVLQNLGEAEESREDCI